MSLPTNVSFSDQKYQGRLQKHMLTAHFYLCLVASFLTLPFAKAQDFLRRYAPSNAPKMGEVNGAMRPLYARGAAWIYNALSFVWNVLTVPFRYLNNYFSDTRYIRLTPAEELKMALDYFTSQTK